MRATSAALRGLKANGIPVTLLAGQHRDHGFTYRAWVSLEYSQREDPAGASPSSWTGPVSGLPGTR